MDRLFRELHDRARLDVAPRVDVMADAGRRRTESLSLAVVISIDDDDRLLRAHIDDELPGPPLLVGCQAQLWVGVGAHRPIDVEPGVHHAHLNESIYPRLGEKIVDVALA